MNFFVEQSWWTFAFLTVILGGGAAFMAGRAAARGWKSPVVLFGNMILLNAGLRFLHFALFGANLISVEYFISQLIVVEILAFIGYRLTLAKLMTAKYPWLFEKTSPFSWRQKA